MSVSATNARSQSSSPPVPEWQLQFQQAIRDPTELCRRLGLPDRYLKPAIEAAQSFPVFVPESYLGRMEPGNPHDPLLRQVLPLEAELQQADGFVVDPVGDAIAKTQPGLIHKYQGRVLLITTGTCAIHCRYCFRRHYAYGEEPNSLDAWEPAFQQIAADPSIHEAILSGGDPLSLSDSKLLKLADRLNNIPHLRRIRFHTRLPIAIPARITEPFVDWLRESRLAKYVVLHVNHANELNDEVLTAVESLRRSGAVLLNQAVLLRGVNDSLGALTDLCATLTNHGVLPYYLNQLDRVQGAAHFEVSLDRGKELIDALRTRLPGYAIPRYVREVAGEPHKIVVS